MFPKNSDSARGKELQAKLPATVTDLAKFPLLTNEDYALVGRIVVLFSYIDFNLKRLAELFDNANVLQKEWAGKTVKLTKIGDVTKAVQSSPMWKGPDDMKAFEDLETYRGIRNLCAHCVMRRFPDDDAYLFLFVNAKDFEREFGHKPDPSVAVTVVMDARQLRETLPHVAHIEVWLGGVVPIFEGQLRPVPILKPTV